MKKFLALILTLAMALSVTACGGSDDTATDDTADQAETETGSETGEVASGVEDGVLTSGFPLGVSNHFTGEPAHISVRDGSLLVIWDKTAGFPVTEQ